MKAQFFLRMGFIEIFLLTLLIYVSVYLWKRNQIRKLKKRIVEVEEEMMRSHAEILTLEAQLHRER